MRKLTPWERCACDAFGISDYDRYGKYIDDVYAVQMVRSMIKKKSSKGYKLTNLEKYKSSIMKWANDPDSNGFCIKHGTISTCDGDCDGCIFFNNSSCQSASGWYLVKWLMSESKDDIKLTESEVNFLKQIQDGYICRGSYDLYWSKNKPIYDPNSGLNFPDTEYVALTKYVVNLFHVSFRFMVPGDMYSIDELLKLNIGENDEI